MGLGKMGLIYFTIKRLFFSAQENLNTICKSKEKNSASEVLLERYGWDNEIITCRIFIDYYIGVYIKKKKYSLKYWLKCKFSYLIALLIKYSINYEYALIFRSLKVPFSSLSDFLAQLQFTNVTSEMSFIVWGKGSHKEKIP